MVSGLGGGDLSLGISTGQDDGLTSGGVAPGSDLPAFDAGRDSPISVGGGGEPFALSRNDIRAIVGPDPDDTSYQPDASLIDRLVRSGLQVS